VSAEAIRIASANATRLGVNISFEQVDVLRPDFGRGRAGAFDIVVSNPPYIPESERPGLDDEVARYEPGVALFVDGPPLLFFEAIADGAQSLLRPGGWLLFETHVDFTRDVQLLLEDSGFVDISVLADLTGRERIVEAKWP
jgi:release factor glutamine methyltransferase